MRCLLSSIPVLTVLLLIPPASEAVEERTVQSGKTEGAANSGAAGQAGGVRDASGLAVPADESGRQAPDNTGRNRDDLRPQADDQSNDSADIELAAAVRRAITDDDTLSLNAHNAKIIVEQGRVTLRGPVDSRAERQRVEAIARKAAGSRPVVNELEVSGR